MISDRPGKSFPAVQGADMRLIFTLTAAACWALFLRFFMKDRSRYRNCYLLAIALLSLVPCLLSFAGERMGLVLMVLFFGTLTAILIVPFFLIHNGFVMIRKEGRHISHLLSLFMGLAILAGEIAAFVVLLGDSSAFGSGVMDGPGPSGWYAALAVLSVSVIYGSLSFLTFMVYVLFLQIIPRKKDFDYVIIHGAGLSGGERVTRLLQERLDKAVEVYRKDPTPPKMIPSGGKGEDEKISEAEAMKRYLLSRGIPESDILMEDASRTTRENLLFSKQILDSQAGRKYTALVTSNYHVYRALRYCRSIGLVCTGIGSHVAFYYWPSALIREFIAIHAEKKHAVLFAAGWLLCMALLFCLLF